jgi:hypothetical protein
VRDDLDALFSRIAHALYAVDAALLSQPLEVSALFTQWAPFAAVARDLNLSVNDEYDRLMMRLLAGEGGYVFADDGMQEDLRRELRRRQPDAGALRAYGAARITLARDAVLRALDLTPEALPLHGSASTGRKRYAPRTNPVGDPTAAPPGIVTPTPSICQFCGERLPDGRPVRFCPECGMNVLLRHCSGCSAEMEPEWKYCINCGRAAG